MNNKTENPSEEYDNGSSIEKTIEQLDKDDPQYADKRESLIGKLRNLRKKLLKQQVRITKQQKELKQLLGNLYSKAAQNPQDEKIQDLIANVELDRAFLTRASAEIVSLKGNWNNEMGKLQGSKNFNVPLDVKIISDAELKPLPSSELTRKKEQVKDIPRRKAASANTKHGNSAAAMAAKILQLRQTTAERTTARSFQTRQRQYTH